MTSDEYFLLVEVSKNKTPIHQLFLEGKEIFKTIHFAFSNNLGQENV